MDLISINQLGEATARQIIDRGIALLPKSKRTIGGLEGRVVFNVFYENSTRTVMSFATAAHRLGATAISMPVEQSSVKKGETLEDTARTLDAMAPDALVVRHGENGAAAKVAECMTCPVINAGDGTLEHPTQALLDAATIQHQFGRIEGVKVAICGDVLHSRVATSTSLLLDMLGAELRFAGPRSLFPDNLKPQTLEDAIEDADVVMMLRVQRERLKEELGDAPGEYLARYGLTAERLTLAKPTAVVMHPGPMNRGVEIEDAVADGPRSLIQLQVAMGVAVRMACLERVIA